MLNGHGPLPAARYRREPFTALVRAVIGQQLSTRAAASIAERLAQRLGGAVTAAALATVADADLRACGLSAAKARTLSALAQAAASGEVDLVALDGREDTQVIATLVALPGIGLWTAHMFLMFGLGRLDVFAPGDLGLRRALQRLDGLAELPAPEVCVTRAERWRPYRTVAAWHLWRWLG